MNIFHVIVLAIIEGLTEFCLYHPPAHMVVASSLMGIGKDEFVKLFEIVIQLGAILSVVVLYFKRFFRSFNFYIKLVIGVIPAVVFGVLFKSKISELLENPLVVGVALVAGGVVLLFVDDWFKNPTVKNEEDISYATALKIGFLSVPCHDTRCIAFSIINNRRYVAKIKQDRCCRVFLLFSSTHNAWRYFKRCLRLL